MRSYCDDPELVEDMARDDAGSGATIIIHSPQAECGECHAPTSPDADECESCEATFTDALDLHEQAA